MPQKYGNRKTIIDGIIFDSRKEADRYAELRLLQKAGRISQLSLQVPFMLAPAQYGERAVKYIADFTYMENGLLVVEDVKGYKTKEYIVKRKWFKDKYMGSGFIVFRET